MKTKKESKLKWKWYKTMVKDATRDGYMDLKAKMN